MTHTPPQSLERSPVRAVSRRGGSQAREIAFFAVGLGLGFTIAMGLLEPPKRRLGYFDDAVLCPRCGSGYLPRRQGALLRGYCQRCDRWAPAPWGDRAEEDAWAR